MEGGLTLLFEEGCLFRFNPPVSTVGAWVLTLVLLFLNKPKALGYLFYGWTVLIKFVLFGTTLGILVRLVICDGCTGGGGGVLFEDKSKSRRSFVEI